ncbi:peptidyl-tRNA hydrolase [Halorhodospira halochloris]|uniref:Peptidyl-tRNA hydrolase n=1 Tax=Halorhodospira halochloris TaxID=1052 RepID=A0A120MZD8_HALHR|nr:aminoacyl-tRNA hydrolase [Halorhodospira halochloris]BAU56473.2 peptidyl-tRNA hydrolase [Halorhodospira halochloris]
MMRLWYRFRQLVRRAAETPAAKSQPKASDPPVQGQEGEFRLIVGLGNPGAKYEGTRHNAGFWFIEELLRRHGGELRLEKKFSGVTGRVNIDGYTCRLLEPTTFMNHSGNSIGAMANYYNIPVQSILVAHDELDLPPGTVRIKRGGGHGGHKGLRHTQATLGSAEFARVRIGVGHPGHRDGVVSHVLSQPSKAERRQLEVAVEEAAEVLPWLLAGDWDRACRQLHG